MEASKRSKLKGEALEQFRQGVSLIFSRWSALQDALSRGWGGPYSREKEASFEASVLSFFCHSKNNETLYIDDLEDLLYDGMDSMSLINDGEVEEVAEKLMIMHGECLEGDYRSIEKLKKAMLVPSLNVVQDIGGDDDRDDNDQGNDVGASMMIDSSGTTSSNNEAAAKDMEVDGWVTVTRKKSKSRNK